MLGSGPPPPLIPGDETLSNGTFNNNVQVYGSVNINSMTIYGTTSTILNNLIITSTTSSINATTGSLIVAGGAGFGSSLYSTGTITGSLLVSAAPNGKAPFVVSSSSLVPLLYVARAQVADNASGSSANSLNTLTLPVVVSGAAAPATGQALIATSSTSATWSTISSASKAYAFYYENGSIAYPSGTNFALETAGPNSGSITNTPTSGIFTIGIGGIYNILFNTYGDAGAPVLILQHNGVSQIQFNVPTSVNTTCPLNALLSCTAGDTFNILCTGGTFTSGSLTTTTLTVVQIA